MAFLTGFIGIDKYADPTIRDLIGARRDATALWALFKDTIPDIQERRLVDADATVAAIGRLFDDTLGAAGPDDIVVLSFAGHGTRAYELVAHDSVLTDPLGSMIPMGEMARRFRESRAKVILCILDCCYSGGAPARVLEDSPIARDAHFPIDDIVLGKGRYLIAAAKIDQRAFENPGTRHGLLTQAIIEEFRAPAGPVNLATMIDAVTRRVAADASRLGYTQNPILFGHTEGGITFPALKAGHTYAREFPDMHGLRVGADLADLAGFGIPDSVLSAWTKQFNGGLNDLQVSAVNEYRILDGASLLVVAPTSAGKTFIGEMAATRAVLDGRKAVFLLPYRALVNEKYDQFFGLYGSALGMRVIRCSGDYLDDVGAFVRGKYDLALLTYEMFLSLVLSNSGVLSHLGLVVLDEAQFISDPRRGSTVELLLTYLIAARDRGINPQLIALSAVIGDVNTFDAWLGVRVLMTTERPVQLIEGVIDRGGVWQYRANGTIKTERLLDDVYQRRDKPSAQDVIVPLVSRLVNQGEKIIVFRNKRGPAKGCAHYLATDLHLPGADDIAAALPTHDPSRTTHDLAICLRGGTAFHSTNLTREERIIVEQAFRDPLGKVRVLGATTTLAAGINTPASTVILAENTFVGDDGRAFTVAEYKNMAGRAGRLGFNEVGKSIILADTAFEREALFEKYVMGTLGPLLSSFNPADVETWVIRLLAQVEAIPEPDVFLLLANTFGGYLAGRANPRWQDTMRPYLADVLGRWRTAGLIENQGEHIQLTLLGRICGRSALSLPSDLVLVDLLQSLRGEPLTAEALIAILQVLPEADAVTTPVARRGHEEDGRPQDVVQRFGQVIAMALQRNAVEPWRWYGRCKRSAVLADWIAGTSIQDIEARYSTKSYEGIVDQGHIRGFADATRLYLRSAQEIASILLIGGAPSAEDVDRLLKQLEFGIPADGLDLLVLPVPLTRGEYLALYRRTIKTPQEFWSAPRDVLEEILGPGRVAAFEARQTSGA